MTTSHNDVETFSLRAVAEALESSQRTRRREHRMLIGGAIAFFALFLGLSLLAVLG